MSAQGSSLKVVENLQAEQINQECWLCSECGVTHLFLFKVYYLEEVQLGGHASCREGSW